MANTNRVDLGAAVTEELASVGPGLLANKNPSREQAGLESLVAGGPGLAQ